MKRLLLIVMAIALVAVGTTAQVTKESRAARKAKMAKDIEVLMTNSHFGVVVNEAYPRGLSPIAINYDRGFTVHGDSLYSNLPYYEGSYQLSSSRDKSLRFNVMMEKCVIGKRRNGQWIAKIKARDESDTYRYELTVNTNGRIDLSVRTGKGRAIRYTGILTTGFKKTED